MRPQAGEAAAQQLTETPQPQLRRSTAEGQPSKCQVRVVALPFDFSSCECPASIWFASVTRWQAVVYFAAL